MRSDQSKKIINPPINEFRALLDLYNRQQFDLLIQNLNIALLKYPRSFELLKLLGGAAASSNQNQLSIDAFHKALKLNPRAFDIHYSLGILFEKQQKFNEATKSYQTAIKIKPDFIEALINLGNIFLRLKKYSNAIQLFKNVIKINPNIPEVYNNFGIALAESGQLNEAVEAYEKAIILRTDFEDSFINKINALSKMQRYEQAIEECNKVLAFNPKSTSAYICKGNNLKLAGRLDDALLSYKSVLGLNQKSEAVYYNIGLVHHQLKQFEDAISSFTKAIEINEHYIEARYNLALTLQDLNRNDEALSLYQHIINSAPNHDNALNNIAVLYHGMGDLNAAINAYMQALKVNPDHADAHNNLGVAYLESGNADLAIKAHEKAIELNPKHADAYNNLGIALGSKGDLDEAISAYKKAVEIDPRFENAESSYLYLNQHICDFSISEILPKAFHRFKFEDQAIPPFTMLSWDDNPEAQAKVSEVWGRKKYTQKAPDIKWRSKPASEKIKIGYFGADFHDHATMYLMNGLLREHDHSKFEIFIYSYGHDKKGQWRLSAQESVNNFYDVAGWSDKDIVGLVHQHEIDIAIDLKGYTQHSRSGLFQYRLAPVQMNYLGYPGTMGVDFIDYIIADPYVISKDHEQHYHEKVIYLPHTYQPNDDKRPISQELTTRSDFGLPDDAFVFCCFNHNYKISLKEFSIWMEILKEVEGSVFWLFKSNRQAEQNLKAEAGKFGIDTNRIIFAERQSHADHISRHKHADLFLDTFNYNAHTTASDALWGGLPVVTKIGEQFAARVGASLLQAVDLPELITTTKEDYKALAISLAKDSATLKDIRQKLNTNLAKKPLFDTVRYTRNFEAGLEIAFLNYQSGKEPSHIHVKED